MMQRMSGTNDNPRKKRKYKKKTKIDRCLFRVRKNMLVEWEKMIDKKLKGYEYGFTKAAIMCNINQAQFMLAVCYARLMLYIILESFLKHS